MLNTDFDAIGDVSLICIIAVMDVHFLVDGWDTICIQSCLVDLTPSTPDLKDKRLLSENQVWVLSVCLHLSINQSVYLFSSVSLSQHGVHPKGVSCNARLHNVFSMTNTSVRLHSRYWLRTGVLLVLLRLHATGWNDRLISRNLKWYRTFTWSDVILQVLTIWF